MSALTYEVKDRNSPVSRWMVEIFPYVREVQAAFRVAAGQPKVMPSPAVAPGTQGAAIDWWLRMLAAPAVDVELPLIGLRTRRVACVPAGLELLVQLGALDAGGRLRLVEPARLAGRPDEWWARVCYALALLVELYRALSVEGSRLQRLSASSRAEDLLGLANDDEVADLIAIRDLARQHLLPCLPAGPVATGMTFDGSQDLAGDADLIAGGLLVEFKAGRGGSPRKDGTRCASLTRADLYQLIGCALMDYSDTYKVRGVGVYAVRFGYFGTWPLRRLADQLAGGRAPQLRTLRRQFAQVLRVELPAYWETRG